METVAATAKSQSEPRARTGLVPYKLAVDQYLRMIDLGFFPNEGRRVELLDGRLFRRMSKNPPHDFAVSMLAALLRASLPAGWFVREEKPIRLEPASLPEPDVAIIRGTLRDFESRTPEASEIALVIEVSDSTYSQDRGPKSRIYAAARIPLYGIVNLRARRFELYSHPSSSGKRAAYQEFQLYEESDSFSLQMPDGTLGLIQVGDLLPRSPIVEQPEPSKPAE